MRKIVEATKRSLAAGLVCMMAFSANAKVIWNDGGGKRDDYRRMAVEMSIRREKVEVRGECASGCTYFAMKEYGIDICAGPLGKLQFHMPFMAFAATDGRLEVVTGRAAAAQSAKEWRRDWLGHFNQKLNRILSDATSRNQIPNPSLTGDNYPVFEVQADLVLPPCQKPGSHQ